MRIVSRRILDGGDVPFLHAYASNRRAIALYESLGFTRRREVLMTRLARARPGSVASAGAGSRASGR